MYVTDYEAEKMRCHIDRGSVCLGPKCMAWRWATFYKNSKTGEAPMKQGAYETGTAAECGYCGLAGVPPINTAID